MGEDRSSTWPTVTELEVTPGDEPEPPPVPVPPTGEVGVDDGWVVPDDPAGLFEEQATRPTPDAESRSTSPIRGANGPLRPLRRARIRTLSRFVFTTPPSVSPILELRLFPGVSTSMPCRPVRPRRTPGPPHRRPAPRPPRRRGNAF